MTESTVPCWGEILHRLGIHDEFLATVQSLYSGCTVTMNKAGRKGRRVTSMNGVRQGCLLSPELIGLLFDGLHRYLAVHCPGLGSRVLGTPVFSSEFADDAMLMEVAPLGTGLQTLLDASDNFFTLSGSQFEGLKSCTTSFGRTDVEPMHIEWHCGDAPLPSMSYTGLMGVFSGRNAC